MAAVSDRSILAAEIDYRRVVSRRPTRKVTTQLYRSLGFIVRRAVQYRRLWRCELARVATCAGGVIVKAVAEYSGSVYSTLYAIRIQDREYLLPAESLEFETSGGRANWQWLLFSRKNQPIGEM